MRWIAVLCVVGCGDAAPEPPPPQAVPCESSESGSVADAETWRDNAAAAACEHGGIAVARPWPALQILCCESLTDDGDWCWTDQISATDARRCCVPDAYDGACFTVTSR